MITSCFLCTWWSPVENVLQQCTTNRVKRSGLYTWLKPLEKLVLHIWRGHLHTYAYIHCLINEMNRLISLFHRRPNTRLLERPCNEKFEAHKVEITLFLSQNSKHKLRFTAYRWHDLAIPCLPLLPFLCLFSFQLLHSLVLLALMLVRPFHKSTQLTKPVESWKATTFSPG